MADNKDENQKKGGIVKIAIFVAAGLVLLGIGLGIGALIFSGGADPDPSAEISEIIDGKKEVDIKKEEEVEPNNEDIAYNRDAHYHKIGGPPIFLNYHFIYILFDKMLIYVLIRGEIIHLSTNIVKSFSISIIEFNHVFEDLALTA